MRGNKLKCSKRLFTIADSFSVLDASGKPGPGLLQGDVSAPGLVGECESIRWASTASERLVHGQLARLRIGPPANGSCFMTFGWDLCVPDACSRDDLLQALSQRKLAAGRSKATSVDLQLLPTARCPSAPSIYSTMRPRTIGSRGSSCK